MPTITLGDAGTDNANFDGESVSLDYFRDRVVQFQQSLNAADMAYKAGASMVAAGISTPAIDSLMDEYRSQYSALRTTAEALNTGAALVNSLGGRAPVLSIPRTLGLPPIVLPLAVVAAVAAVSSYVAWTVGYTSAMQDAINIAAQSITETVSDEGERAAAIEHVTSALGAARESHTLAITNPLAGIGGAGNVLQTVLFAVGAWLAYKAFKDSQRD